MTMATFAGFVAVATLFVASALLQGRRSRGTLLAAVVEAATLTLIGALWLFSLGRGSWLTLFLLLGLLAAAVERGTQPAVPRSAFALELARTALVMARYAAAGGLLAWLLG